MYSNPSNLNLNEECLIQYLNNPLGLHASTKLLQYFLAINNLDKIKVKEDILTEISNKID